MDKVEGKEVALRMWFIHITALFWSLRRSLWEIPGVVVECKRENWKEQIKEEKGHAESSRKMRWKRIASECIGFLSLGRLTRKCLETYVSTLQRSGPC